MKKNILVSLLLFSLVAAGCNKTTTNTTPVEPVQTSEQPTGDTKPVTTNSYTLAEVKTHNKATDCWIIVKGSVYDVTKFIPNHPGGPARIIPLCGTDASSNFSEQHEGQPEPAAQLASFNIGTLK